MGNGGDRFDAGLDTTGHPCPSSLSSRRPLGPPARLPQRTTHDLRHLAPLLRRLWLLSRLLHIDAATKQPAAKFVSEPGLTSNAPFTLAEPGRTHHSWRSARLNQPGSADSLLSLILTPAGREAFRIARAIVVTCQASGVLYRRVSHSVVRAALVTPRSCSTLYVVGRRGRPVRPEHKAPPELFERRFRGPGWGPQAAVREGATGRQCTEISRKRASLTRLPESQVGGNRCDRVISLEGRRLSPSFPESAQELALLTEVHNLS
jgi:hypothetical protein